MTKSTFLALLGVFLSTFDGLAGYETEDSLFSNLHLHDNLAAGLSFDIHFNNNIIHSGTIVASHKVGIFMRDSNGNAFTSLQIRQSGEHGVFLAQVDTDTTKPATGNSFSGMLITDSGTSYADNQYSGQATAVGFRVNDASCVDNLLCSSQLFRNKGGGTWEAVSGLLQSCGNRSR